MARPPVRRTQPITRTKKDKARFLRKVKTDKVFLLSMLNSPAVTLSEYDYSAPQKTVGQLDKVRDDLLKRYAAALPRTLEVGTYATDRSFLLSMIDDAPRTIRKYRLSSQARELAQLDKLSADFLKRASAVFEEAIKPVADNLCEGCNLC